MVTIRLPYPEAKDMAAVWKNESAFLDFRAQPEQAARCTLSFAALELQHYLQRSLQDAAIEVQVGEYDPADAMSATEERSSATSDLRVYPQDDNPILDIRLAVEDPASRACEYRLVPNGANQLMIIGAGRTGTLYGVYALLRLQGWQWFAPGVAGEIEPELRDRLLLPQQTIEGAPSMSLGRGFDFEFVSMESGEMTLWMARNRLNVAGYRPNTAPLAQMLGMSFKMGGHIFEDILDPDRRLTNGEKLWDTHRTWYGLPQSGERTKDQALRTQFCVSQTDLLTLLGDEMVQRLQGEWKEADYVDVWGFDTWGSSCTCEDCTKLGNSTDQMLHLAAALRQSINQALASGELTHPVQMVLCSYEGTCTIAAPEKPTPQVLLDAGDRLVVYPINRCYAHDWDDSDCTINSRYAGHLQDWTTPSERLPIVMGEYYNVSKFEDLPLSFMRSIAHDLPTYYQAGVRGMTYMHVPMINWGTRTLTQLAYSQLLWDIDTDMEAFYRQYFSIWYGPYAAEMQQVYHNLEEGWKQMADWRAWKGDSVLSRLMRWSGERPEQSLTPCGHLDTPQTIATVGETGLSHLDKALHTLSALKQQDKLRFDDLVPTHREAAAVNPAELRRINARKNLYGQRLNEDWRSVRYGKDMLEILVRLAGYHDSLHRDGISGSVDSWNKVEEVAERLTGYLLPITYEQPLGGLVSKDAMQRSQLGETIRRCRMYRYK